MEIRWIPGSENLFLAAHSDGSLIVYDKEKEDAVLAAEEGETAPGSIPGDTPPMTIHKSVNSTNQKSNPVSFWKLSNKHINSFTLAPDRRHLAVVSEDGDLCIIDYLKER